MRYRHIMLTVVKRGITVTIDGDMPFTAGRIRRKYQTVSQASADRLLATIPSDPRVSVNYATIWLHWDLWTS